MVRTRRFTTGQVCLALLAIVVLFAAQLAAMLLTDLAALAGAPDMLCNALTGTLYAGLALALLTLLCRKGLRCAPSECRLFPVRVEPRWVCAAVLMPVLVSALLLLLPGHWEGTPAGLDRAAAVTYGVFSAGLGAGVVEEAVFRGVILTALERRWNRTAAVLVPSAAFGLVHLIGNPMGPASALQLLLAGTAVGVLFSLVTLESGSIWCSALMHGVWNVVMIGGIVSIGVQADAGSLYSYVLDVPSRLLTGGEFGVESSLFAILVYLAFAFAAFWSLRRGERTPAPSGGRNSLPHAE